LSQSARALRGRTVMHATTRPLLTRRAAALAALGILLPLLSTPSLAADPVNLDWRYYGNDLANTRFQDVDQITPSNAGQLQPAWVFHTGMMQTPASFEVSPIVVDGTMYISTGHDDLFAIDAATGSEKWEYHATDMPPDLGGPGTEAMPICCGEDNRGVAYGDGMVFMARLDATLVALDASSGEVRWEATVADWHKGFSETMAPQYVNGTLIVGISGGEYDTQDFVAAYDASSGKQVWRTSTIKPDSWAGDSWKTGGASVWGNPTVDPDLGLVYVGTGNAGPDYFGGSRKGDNLYSSSVLALDVKTGDVKWAFQETHHDLWDYDGPQPPVLFTLTKDGTRYPALGHCNKNGNYFILDRRTGKPIFPVTEQKVPTSPSWQAASPTQPISSIEHLTPWTIGLNTSGYKAAPMFTPPGPTPMLYQPGSQAGCEWFPAAYSPRTHDVYYGARYEPVLLSSHRVGQEGSAGNANLDLGSASVMYLPGTERYGIFGATDTQTGKIVWQTRVPQLAGSGMAIGGDVAFFGEENGKFHAVNAADGTNLWTFNAPKMVPKAGGADDAPSVYVANGR